MINPDYESLINLLEQEEAIYGEMAGLLEQEREALLAMALELLGELTGRKETLGLRIKAMDESRKLLARRLGTVFGLTSDQLTLTELSRRAPVGLGARLEAAGRKLKETVAHCQTINNYNARAAHRGMDLVSGSIEYLIAQADPAGRVYQAPRPKGGGGYAQTRRPATSSFISRQV